MTTPPSTSSIWVPPIRATSRPAGIARRDRVEALADAHPGLGVDPDRTRPARQSKGSAGSGRRAARSAARRPAPTVCAPAADVAGEVAPGRPPPAARLSSARRASPSGIGTKWRRRKRPTSPSTPPFSWAPRSPGLAEERVEAIVGAQRDEALGLDRGRGPRRTRATSGPGVVVADPAGHAAEAREGDDVALEERLLALGAEGDVDRGARVGQAQLEHRDPGRARRR